MTGQFQARWISRRLSDHVRKAGTLGEGLILDSCKGFIVLEPKGKPIGDGSVLSAEVARFELQAAFCTDSPAKVKKARQLLGLDEAREYQSA